MAILDDFRHARRAGVPLVAIQTPDPAETIKMICEVVGDAPLVVWDAIRGCYPGNEAGESVAAEIESADMGTKGSLTAFLVVACGMPKDTVAVAMNAEQWLCGQQAEPQAIQAAWNLRDWLKIDGRMVVMLGPSFILPAALQGDVVVLDEELPGENTLRRLVVEIDDAERIDREGKERRPTIDGEQAARAVAAVQGLSAFAAEQALAMSLNGQGLDLDRLWERKRQQIEQTRGLSVYRGTETFESLGGLTEIKEYLRGVMNGRRSPSVIVHLDEIEKTGLSARMDTSGVSQDQEGTLLSWMEDRDVFGVMLLGVPGAGKSAVCKACAGEFGKPVVQIDLGGMQGSLVGESQQAIRRALKVVDAMGGGDVLWLATSNSVDGLSAAMRSRFVDTFFFDLPDERERQPIWQVWCEHYHEDGSGGDWSDIADDGWVGRNIRQCVEKAWRLNVRLKDAARYIVPVGAVEKAEIERLRNQAAGRFLSASEPGVYRLPKTTTKRRRVAT